MNYNLYLMNTSLLTKCFTVYFVLVHKMYVNDVIIVPYPSQTFVNLLKLQIVIQGQSALEHHLFSTLMGIVDFLSG